MLAYYEKELEAILGSVVSNSEGTTAIVSEELLRSEHIKQRKYFTHTAPLIHRPYLDIYKAVLNEEAAEERLKNVDDRYPESELDDHNNDMYLSELESAKADLARARSSLSIILKKFSQDRDEWYPGSERYALAASLSNQEHKVYDAIVAESVARRKEEAINEETKTMSTPSEAHLKAVARYASAAKKATEKVNAELARINAVKADWEEGTDNYKKQFRNAKLTELRVIYNRLLRHNASRTLEMRRVKARTFSGKQAGKMWNEILSKHSAMQKDIDKFNAVSKLLPAEFQPGLLTLAAFKGTEDANTPGSKSEQARDALFKLHLLNSDVLGTTGPDSTSYWAGSDKVRVGISHQLRRDRCTEEIQFLQQEWLRHLNFTKKLLGGLVAFAKEFQENKGGRYCQTVYEMMWNELPAAESLISASRKAQQNGQGLFRTDDLEWIVSDVRGALAAHYINPTVATYSAETVPTQQSTSLPETNNDFKVVNEKYFPDDEMEDVIDDEAEREDDDEEDDEGDGGVVQLSSVLGVLDLVTEKLGMEDTADSASDSGFFDEDK